MYVPIPTLTFMAPLLWQVDERFPGCTHICVLVSCYWPLFIGQILRERTTRSTGFWFYPPNGRSAEWVEWRQGLAWQYRLWKENRLTDLQTDSSATTIEQVFPELLYSTRHSRPDVNRIIALSTRLLLAARNRVAGHSKHRNSVDTWRRVPCCSQWCMDANASA